MLEILKFYVSSFWIWIGITIGIILILGVISDLLIGSLEKRQENLKLKEKNLKLKEENLKLKEENLKLEKDMSDQVYNFETSLIK